jgi:1-aminocyclopropane-1-carboxylate deaminase/D-cysteine desulfhydrase
VNDLPRIPLATLPTPFHRLPRFGGAIGAEVWIKRDDMGSVGLAGNKVRKLEYVLADARGQGADTIVIIGAEQSNAARATAAACAQTGLRCVLVLSGDPGDSGRAPSGNLLLDRLFGAEVHFAGDVGWAELWEASQRIGDELRSEGATPYTLPAGASSPLGACGFVQAWSELQEQGTDARTLYFASSSCGTYAGLLLGRAMSGNTGPELRAIGVAPDVVPDVPGYVAGLAAGAAELLGADVDIPSPEIDMGFLGDGYAIPTPEANEAIRLLARTEGIVCDPVYSGKALAALVAADHDGPTIFWHTGGYHALFAPRFGAAVLSR